MENSSLNASHRYARQANRYFLSCKFDKAIEAHENAKAKIDQAMATATVPKVLESLHLQKQFHTKQIDFVLVQREQYAQIQVDKGATFRKNLDAARDVSQELIKSMDNAEKVVEVLEQKTQSTSSSRESAELLTKLFEDLKLLNHQSMILCNRLVHQLHDRVGENEDLRAMLEENRMTIPAASSSSARNPSTPGKDTARKTVMIDSDPDLEQLEELAPLELPQFDFNTFSALSADGRSAGEGDEDSSTGEPTHRTPPKTDNETLRRIGLRSLEKEPEDNN